MVLVLLSPSKTLDNTVRRTGLKATCPHFHAQAQELVAALKKYSKADLSKLMSISDKLAQLNADRFKHFADQPETLSVLTYQGDTYQGLNAADLSDEDLRWAQDHVGILSGLYGVLRPLDAMQAYRLEMSTVLPVQGHKNLYHFWGPAITDHLNALVKKNKISAVIGCASNEYLSAVHTKELSVPFIDCMFKENKNGKLQVVGLFAKRARGMMARYVIDYKITDAKKIQKFASAGYKFDKSLSTETEYVFVR